MATEEGIKEYRGGEEADILWEEEGGGADGGGQDVRDFGGEGGEVSEVGEGGV